MPWIRSLALCSVLALSACASTPAAPPADTTDSSELGDHGDDGLDQLDDGLETDNSDDLGDLGDLGDLDPELDQSELPPDLVDTEEDTNPIICVPNRDGIITRQEVPLRTGLKAIFEVASDVTVDLTGTTNPDSTRAWNFTGPYTGDHAVLAELRPVGDFWFAADFPNATYATPLSDSSELLGIFEITDDALLLRGLASPTDDFPMTRLSYSPAITVLSFPFELGDTWSTDASVSGWLKGSLWTQSEKYSSTVDAGGTLKTPFGTFDAMRVRTDLQRVVGIFTTDIRSFAFVAECFGTVATVSSKDNPTELEFTEAAEIRRLSP